jgi:polysaccharide pyruvyl transferase WcaK-like protein
MGMTGARDPVYPDLVFALPIPPSRQGSESAIGVGIMAYAGTSRDRRVSGDIQAEYVAKMKRFVRWLVEEGHRVRLLIGDAADEPVAEAIIADVHQHWRHADALPVTYESISSITELMSHLASLDTVVATRYHNVLAALKCGKPTLAIGYGRKHSEVMAQMGVDEFVQDIRALDVELLKEQFTTLQTYHEQVSRTLAMHNQANRTRLKAQFAELNASLFAAAAPRARSSAH